MFFVTVRKSIAQGKKLRTDLDKMLGHIGRTKGAERNALISSLHNWAKRHPPVRKLVLAKAKAKKNPN